MVLSLKQKIALYYKNYFDMSDLLDLLGDTPFECREFAFETFVPDKSGKRFIWKRNYSFDDPEDLKNYMIKHPPRKAYFGALYDTPISGSVSDANWVSATLKFDIDIDESELIREYLCKCKEQTNAVLEKTGKKVKLICDKCAKVAVEAVLFLIDTLEDDFGITDPYIYFSGSRGFHVHYPNVKQLHSYDSMRMEHKARENMIYYLTTVREETTDDGIIPNIVRDFDKVSVPLKRRIEKTIVPWYFQNAPLDHLKSLKWKKYATRSSSKGLYPKNVTAKEKEEWLKEKMKLMKRCTLFNESFAKENMMHYEKSIENAMIYRAPRYDGSPTTDVKKVIKIPNSIDASKGYLVQKFTKDELKTFSLGKVKRIHDFSFS